MLSVLVTTHAVSTRRPVSHGAVVRTLSSLVAAVIDGVVRDVLLLAENADKGFTEIADHAGCELVNGSSQVDCLRRGGLAARCPFVLIVEGGTIFDRGLVDELHRIGPELPEAGPSFAYALRSAPRRWVERMVPALSPVRGLLLPRDRLRSDARDVEALRRGSRPLLRLATAVQAGEIR